MQPTWSDTRLYPSIQVGSIGRWKTRLEEKAAARNMGLEGIVAKRRDSRCRDSIKIKNLAHPAIERAMLIALSKRQTKR